MVSCLLRSGPPCFWGDGLTGRDAQSQAYIYVGESSFGDRGIRMCKLAEELAYSSCPCPALESVKALSVCAQQWRALRGDPDDRRQADL